MSIATQIQRLINAKNAIKSSIINKSVTVDNTIKLDGYGALINNIGMNSNIGPADVIKGKRAFGNNGKYFSGTALSVQTSANNTCILNGFTAYDSNGNLINGIAMPNAATALNNRIMSGYTAYDNKGKLLKGNAFGNNTNATNSSLLKGHTAYLNNGMWLNGTAFGNNTNAINAVILNGYTAYLNNGFYLQGTALNNTTSAFNNKILKGFTAYNSNGGWLVGTAFANTTTATNSQILVNQTAYLNNGVYLVGTMENKANTSLSSGSMTMNNTSFALNSPVNAYVSTTTQFYKDWESLVDDAYQAEEEGKLDFKVGRIGYDIVTTEAWTYSIAFECNGRPRGYALLQMSDTKNKIWDTTDRDQVVISIQDVVWAESPSETTQNVVSVYGHTTSKYDDRARIRTYENAVNVTYYSSRNELGFDLNDDAPTEMYFYGKYRLLYWY